MEVQIQGGDIIMQRFGHLRVERGCDRIVVSTEKGIHVLRFDAPPTDDQVYEFVAEVCKSLADAAGFFPSYPEFQQISVCLQLVLRVGH